jgi:outer membrane protein assembly factor BamB
MALAAGVGAALSWSAPAWAVTVSGTVYADMDHDGFFSAADIPIPNCVVAWEKTVFARTDANGRYALSVPSDGLIWARTPDGFTPGPVWQNVVVSRGDQVVDLPLIAASPGGGGAAATTAGGVSFVQAADIHMGVVDGAATARAFAEVSALVPAPAFLTVLGDVTQSNDPAQYQALHDALGSLTIPFVPVPGNHDWPDGGALYRSNFGPPSYSFDAGGVHFVVLELPAGNWDADLAFLDQDLAYVVPGTPIAVFTHFPPALSPEDDPFISGLVQRGVKWLFTGHWHQNRVLRHDNGLIDFNMSPMVMAGVDLTPGGFRVVTIRDGMVSLEPHTSVDAPVFRVVTPPQDGCVPPGPLPLAVDVEAGRPSVLKVTGWLDGGSPFSLIFQGGWAWSTSLSLAAEGSHQLRVTLEGPGLSPRELVTTFCVRALPPASATLADWPQLQGGPTHQGFSRDEIRAPMHTRWATTVGGHLRGGSPVLAGARLFVPVIDPGDGARGGVVALDAATGATLWARRLGRSVNNAPAAADGLVVASEDDGHVIALDAATGETRWELDIAEGLAEGSSNLYAAPTIADGIVYVGVVERVAAIDLATGRALWQRNPSNGPRLDATYAAIAVDSGIAVAVFGRGYEGLVAFDAYEGGELWRGPSSLSVATSASPIISGDRVFSGNSATDVYQLDLFSGMLRWDTRLDRAGHTWGYWIAATPALARGVLVVPTQEMGLVSLDDTGHSLWDVPADPSVLHPVHYQTGSSSYPASPVVTGHSVWIGGADGILRQVDLSAGQVTWSTDLGAPILSGVVPASPMLFVATWDGTVRGLESDDRTPPSDDGGGCDVSFRGRNPAVPLGLTILAFGLAMFWRRRGARQP